MLAEYSVRLELCQWLEDRFGMKEVSYVRAEETPAGR